MQPKKLKLNLNKMEMLLAGRGSDHRFKMSPILDGTALPLKEQGVLVDLGWISRRQLWPGVPFTSFALLRQLWHVLGRKDLVTVVTSSLDYCQCSL